LRRVKPKATKEEHDRWLYDRMKAKLLAVFKGTPERIATEFEFLYKTKDGKYWIRRIPWTMLPEDTSELEEVSMEEAKRFYYTPINTRVSKTFL